MKNLTKFSRKRLLISGDIIELYEYEKIYSYNADPLRLSGGSESDESGETRSRRGDNLGFVRSQIRRLIECNYKKFGYPPVFLTLTFHENITDIDIANAHFHDFIKRLNRRFQRRFRYLAIVEFQERGAVHYHCVFFNMGVDLELRERRTRDIAQCWDLGFVDIERIRHAKSVSAYVCKYLDKGVHDPRLVGRKAFFTSRNLFRPQQIRNEKRIDRILATTTMEIVRVEDYQSLSRGNVKYTQYVKR